MANVVPWLAGALIGGALLSASSGDDLAAKLKALKVADRLAAVETIRRDGTKAAEKLLQDALDDHDWEVIERSAAALGERGTTASINLLAKLTLDGPIRRVRVAAAAAMAKLDAKAAADHLTKAAKGATLLRAIEGLAAIAATAGEAARPGLEIGLLSKDLTVRVATAAGLHAWPKADRAAAVENALRETELSIGSAALDSVRLHPDPADAALTALLLKSLADRHISDVIERRIDRAMVATLAAATKEQRAELTTKLLDAAKAATAEPGLTRFARLIGLAAEKPDDPKQEPLVAAAAASEALAPIATSSNDAAMAAAARSLARIEGDAAIAKLGELVKDAGPSRVRSLALRQLAELTQLSTPGAVEAAKRALADHDADVVEDAVVALGRPGIAGAVAALTPLLADARWPIAVAAAVSLGKTHDPAAFEPLAKLATNKDWKLKDAAIAGLGHLEAKPAVPLLIDALGGKDATAKLTAYGFLRRMTNDKLPAKESNWKAWWAKNEAAYQFPDRSEAAKQQKKYGYAPSSYGVYEDLDILVFQSPVSGGDHIEQLLDKLKIEHRMTKTNAVGDTGVTPLGLYVANCTGQCSPDDLEYVRWFVHAGGYLFSSCWALTYHSQEVGSGFVRGIQLNTITDLVTAEPCGDSPYLTGVFDGFTRPKYVLDGPHLIELLDPERVEVLIDSPECATRHNSGNLAAWWRVGHGLILDSVNHFDLQGFERAPPMKEAGERMAYAIDVLGLNYEDWRDVPKGAWASSTKVAEEVRDLSAFRFITNFVREKRKSGS